MGLKEIIHERYVHDRRVRVLSRRMADLLPENAKVLDIGCGDGLLASLMAARRPDVSIRGIDVTVRPRTLIPVDRFDGQTLPFDDRSFDVVMFVDVLHHTRDPMVLLREARRVAGKSIALKDHTLNGLLAGPTLRFMDRTGNARHGVELPYNYWPLHRWNSAFKELGLRVRSRESSIGLYPFPFGLLFDRSLHFIAALDVS